jgi:thymidylate synthase (FAD)
MKINLIFPLDQKPLLEILYTAYRICYSSKPVSEIREEIKSGKITETQIKKFLRERFKTGHTSPLRQLHFVFTIEGVSRVLTAQFNRHTVGVDRCEMSQRYIKIKNNPYVTPFNITDNKKAEELFGTNMATDFEDYNNLIDMGINQEDARYMLPMGTESREQFSISFEALQNFLDVRLCEKAQWEIRDAAWKIYKIMRKNFPFLSSALGIKCWSNRLGYCNEAKKCDVWGKKRPNKEELMKLWKNN